MNFNRLIKRETFISHKWPIKRLQSELPCAEPRFFLPTLLSFSLSSGEQGKSTPQARPSPARCRTPGARPRRQACTGTQEPAEPASGGSSSIICRTGWKARQEMCWVNNLISLLGWLSFVHHLLAPGGPLFCQLKGFD